jgi:hypothetical protein
MPDSIKDRYDFIETRNAAATFKASHPDPFNEMVRVLDAFYFDVERIVRPGGNKHFISAELDEAFRVTDWREAKFVQTLTTDLVLNPYRPAGEQSKVHRVSTSEYQGHQIDNVKGRVGLDVEWNPKDGNLDRDFSNFRNLYDAGVLDLGVLVVRREEGMRDLWYSTIARAKALDEHGSTSTEWSKRLKKTPADPLGTATTSNFEKLVPRIERGDGGGCPILAIAITTKCYRPPTDLDAEIRRVAVNHTVGGSVERLAQRLNPTATLGDLDDVVNEPDENE